MIVTFVSQCQKKSLNLTRQTLDAFANRIGEHTWQTVITQEGLNAVRSQLARHARKTTAVACHRMRGTHQTELLWIVGNRRQFNSEGHVPVNRTQRDLLKERYENDWTYLPLIQTLSTLAALLHDLGKSWTPFQQLLKGNNKEPVRHEWVSLMLFKALTEGKSDEEWLAEFIEVLSLPQDQRQAYTNSWTQVEIVPARDDKPFKAKLPPLATWLAWLIVTHHRLPMLFDPNDKPRPSKAYQEPSTPISAAAMLNNIHRDTGYVKPNREELSRKHWDFKSGTPLESKTWCKQVARWCKKAQVLLPQMPDAQAHERLILHHARLTLMLADHEYSSRERDPKWKSDSDLIANTDQHKAPKQYLDEHLVHVADLARQLCHQLPRFESQLPRAQNLRNLRKASPKAYGWQNKAVATLKQWRQNHDLDEHGFFAINMASTGCGKTIANAKVMYALSDDDSLRYNLALGLRTLTLQTGDAYKDHIHLDDADLAVLIGSQAVRELYEHDKQEPTPTGAIGSESAEDLLKGLDVYSHSSDSPDLPMSTLLTSTKKRQLLYAPVLVSTIDHLMPATESTRGGHHILPALRLMSSDLVIDEVDDFSQQDLPAISRLVHLCGMLGRKLMISSATIPPAVAEGLFHAYQQGWQHYAATRHRKSSVSTFWLDEFNNHMAIQADQTHFAEAHDAFIQKRLSALAKQNPAKHQARLWPLVTAEGDEGTRQQQWFAGILNAALDLHAHHHERDSNSGKDVSIGVVRIANIEPVIALSEYLLQCDLPDDIAIRVMPYHARQVLLLRSEQEHYLDTVLNRKGNKTPWQEPAIQRHLNNSFASQVIFILVASPVEEVGRDHDLNWAVIEPSSMRSLIQMAGRVWRHRPARALSAPNIHILQYNLKAYQGRDKAVFCRPGYESETHPLHHHDMNRLIDIDQLAQRLDASPRIAEAQPLQPNTRLADLEHRVLRHSLTDTRHSPDTTVGWVHSAYYLTALSQQTSPFRKGLKETEFKLSINADDELEARYADPDQDKAINHIHITPMKDELRKRLWLDQDYQQLVQTLADEQNMSLRQVCGRYGLFNLRDEEGLQHFDWDSNLGFRKRRNA